MIRVFKVKAYWKDTGRLRKEYIIAKDEKDIFKKVTELGGNRIRYINEDFNHLPNKSQLLKAKKLNIEVENLTRKELGIILKKSENKL